MRHISVVSNYIKSTRGINYYHLIFLKMIFIPLALWLSFDTARMSHIEIAALGSRSLLVKIRFGIIGVNL